MNKDKFGSKLRKLLSSSSFRAMSLCVFFSFLLWMFITFSDYRQHEFEIPIRFENSNKPDEIYFTRDSVVVVKVEATGFAFLFKSGFTTKKEKINFDINNLPINKSKGEMKFSSDFLKAPVAKSLGMEGFDISILPDTILLKWQKKYVKSVPVVSNAKFETKNSYTILSKPVLLTKEVTIEGEKRILDKIDTIYTKEVTIENIDKSHVSLIPIDMELYDKGVYFHTTNIPVKIEVAEVTENVVELPVNIIQQGVKENVKIFPAKVSVKYSVPIKDYKKVKAEDFEMYVLCSEEELNQHKKLVVKYSNVPKEVEILSITPRKVDYIIVNE